MKDRLDIFTNFLITIELVVDYEIGSNVSKMKSLSFSGGDSPPQFQILLGLSYSSIFGRPAKSLILHKRRFSLVASNS